MKIHKHLLDAVVNCLKASFGEGFYVDKVIAREIKQHPKWGSRDRKFFAETSYDMTRWWRRLWYALDREETVVDQDLYHLFAVYFTVKNIELPDWQEWQGLDLEKAKKRYNEVKEPAIKASVPDWIYQLFLEQYADKTELALAKMNEQADVVLRVNTLKISREELHKHLTAEGLSTELVDNYPSAIRLVQRTNVFQTNAFKKGFFEVQDGASQTVAPLLDLQPKMRVVDACAGAGGKSLHIASLMDNKGTLISLDIHEHKLIELKKRAKRAGVSIIDTRAIQTTKVIKRLHESADRLLLDVPCSGLGVLRRNPDTKWKLQESRLSELCEIQLDILSRYSKMVKPGGKMLYATCSILKRENEDQVEKFLADHPEWSLEFQERHHPHIEGFDGFYAALLVRQ
ncbi:MAG: SAM-dependent methyltransferase [Bdellovibrionota bacterium]|nr:SAM-dependent methyltransferase [Bdellovibrionota bacterium]